MRIESPKTWAVNLTVVNRSTGWYPVYVGCTGSDSYYLRERYTREGVLSSEIILEIKRK